MTLTLVTPADSDPVSLAEAKAHCRIDSTSEDGLLAGYVLAARQYTEAYLRRVLVTQTWDLKIDCDWPRDLLYSGERYHRIELPLPPLQSVTSITYRDTADASQTLATTQYRVARVNERQASGVIDPAYGVTWPSVRDQSETITVRFVAGYDNTSNPLPEEIRQGMLLLIGHWYAVRETVNVGNITSELPFTVEALLCQYRVY